jgi:hypothetical protein
MTRIDDLPPDQRAVLSLLLRQGKDYEEIAAMLGIPASVVRERARAALDALEGVRPARPARPASGAGARVAPHASRRAGALLLGAIVLAAILAIVLLSGGGSHKGSASASTTTSTTSQAKLEARSRLTPVDPSSKALGVVQIASQEGHRAFFVLAEGLAPSKGFFYVAWLYNSTREARALGRAPNVTANGRLQAVALLPEDAGKYHTFLITRETSEHPTRPGPTVLRGPFSL